MIRRNPLSLKCVYNVKIFIGPPVLYLRPSLCLYVCLDKFCSSFWHRYLNVCLLAKFTRWLQSLIDIKENLTSYSTSTFILYCLLKIWGKHNWIKLFFYVNHWETTQFWKKQNKTRCETVIIGIILADREFYSSELTLDIGKRT